MNLSLDFHLTNIDRNIDGAPSSVQLRDLDDISCLLIVGQPGSGKSALLQSRYQSVLNSNKHARWVNCAHLQNEDDFYAKSMPNQTEIDEIGATTDEWHLFIDGLDSFRGRQESIWRWLANVSKQLAKTGILSAKQRFRISSRPIVGLSIFRETIATAFPQNQIQIYEIGQLSKSEIAAFVENSMGNNTAFLEFIEKYQLHSLTETPATLQLLVDIFPSANEAPTSKASLVRIYLRQLLEKTIIERGYDLGYPSWDELLKATANLAATMTLSGRISIWTGSPPGPSHSLTFSLDIEGIPKSLITALLDAGLLAGEYGGELLWRHKMLAEYLTALAISSAAPSDLGMSVLQSEVAGSIAIKPQLREVAAWLAIINSQFATLLIASQPEILFESENALSDDEARCKLANALLQAADDPSLRMIFRRNRDQYPRLVHKGLKEQLSESLENQNFGLLRRITAIEIAVACQVFTLSPKVLEIAIDKSQPTAVRVQATQALLTLGTALELEKAKELISLNADEDPEDEIRGSALEIVWPDFISASELFEVLWPPRNKNLIGSYSHFLYNLSIPKLDRQSALAGCNWLAQIDQTTTIDYSFSKIAPQVLMRVWENCEDIETLRAFASLLIPKRGGSSELADFELNTFLNEYHQSKPERRRSLFLELVRQAKDIGDACIARLRYSTPWPIVGIDDLGWLIDELKIPLESEVEELILDRIVSLTLSQSVSDAEFVWEASEKDSRLSNALEQATTIALDSEMARYGRERARRDKERIKKEPEKKQSARDQFTLLVRATSNGDATAWWQLNILFLSSQDGAASEYHARIDNTPLWSQLEAIEREKVIAGAKTYLEGLKLKDDWLRPGSHHRPAAAAYRALRLLDLNDRQYLLTAETPQWNKWSLPLLAFTGNDGADERNAQRLLVKMAFECNNSAILDASQKYFTRLGSEGLLHFADLIRGWSEVSIINPMWEQWESESDIGRLSHTAKVFAEAKYPPFYRNFFRRLRTLQGDETEEKIVAGMAGAIFNADPKYSSVWVPDLLSQGSWLTPAVLSAIAGSSSASIQEFLSELPIQSIESIFEYADEKFPPPASNEGAYVFTDAHYMEEFRQGILLHLKNRSSDAAVQALRQISAKRPEKKWLAWHIREAVENAREAKVDWPNPIDILRLVASPIHDAGGEAPPIPKAEDVSLVTAPAPTDALNAAEVIAVKAHKKMSFLFFADEWFSGRGGISTINRDLCVALATQGHKVYCFIPRPTSEEISIALSRDVTIVGNALAIGLEDSQLMAIGPLGGTPDSVDFVVGHDNITGPSACAWASRNSGTKYIHIIHSLPEEIATARLFGDARAVSMPTEEKRLLQENLSRAASLVVCVGPRLHAEMTTALAGDGVPLWELLPGLNSELQSHTCNVEELIQRRCLFIGRGEDVAVKGLDLLREIAKGITDVDTEFVFRGVGEEDGKKLFSSLPPLCARFRPYCADPKIVQRDLKSASLLVMPSRAEGFGLVALEALSAGMPVIISNRSGLAQLLVRLARDGKISSTLANNCILPITESADGDLVKWNLRIADLLKYRGQAFLDAAQLRKELQEELSWPKAARDLVTRLSAIS